MTGFVRHTLASLLALCLLFANNGLAISVLKADAAPTLLSQSEPFDVFDTTGDRTPDPSNAPGEKCNGDDETWVRVTRTHQTDVQHASRVYKHQLVRVTYPGIQNTVRSGSLGKLWRLRSRLVSYRQFFATTMCMRT